MKLNDLKTTILAVVFFVGLGIAFSSFAKLPEKVKEVAKKAEEVDDKVEKLANNMDKFLEVNKEQKTAQEKREELMLKLFEKLSEGEK